MRVFIVFSATSNTLCRSSNTSVEASRRAQPFQQPPFRRDNRWQRGVIEAAGRGRRESCRWVVAVPRLGPPQGSTLLGPEAAGPSGLPIVVRIPVIHSAQIAPILCVAISVTATCGNQGPVSGEEPVQRGALPTAVEEGFGRA